MTESDDNQEVTCRKCSDTYCPSFMKDFYPDGEDPTIGLCEQCMMRELLVPKVIEPFLLPNPEHAKSVCGIGNGEATCAFLVMGAGGFQCAKASDFEPNIRSRLAKGSMNAKGDNCSGSPDFILAII